MKDEVFEGQRLNLFFFNFLGAHSLFFMLHSTFFFVILQHDLP